MRALLRALRDRLRADARAFGRRWEGESDRRGMVMVTTLLMMTILALLGSAATNATATQLRENGATRLEHITFRVGEAGTMSAVSLAAQLQSRFEAYVQNRNYKLDVTDVGSLFDFGSKGKLSGSFGVELLELAKQPTFTVEVGAPNIAYGVAGYDASRYCFRSYEMRTTAQVGDPTSGKGAVQATSGQIAFQAGVTVGPVRCGD